MRHIEMYKQPGYLIRRLHQRSTAEFATVADRFEITQVQLSILLVVADYPGIDATRISELIGSDRTTIGQALLRLEAKGLLQRETGTHDKRTKRLVITAHGQTISDTVANDVSQIGDAILRGLDAKERHLFMRLLTKLVATSEGPRAVGESIAVPGAAEPASVTQAATIPDPKRGLRTRRSQDR